MAETAQDESAISYRNKAWRQNDAVPAWVDLDEVGLDQFFTRPEVAKACLASLSKVIAGDDVDAAQCTFLEPSAGSGAFFNLLPAARRIGLDVAPKCRGVDRQDFLSYSPPEDRQNLVVVGNPPFGYRAWLALAFVNHAATFADYVGFILPMAFQSEGKGSPRRRVKGMTLVHSEILPPNSFVNPQGKSLAVNTLWQIWRRGENSMPAKADCSAWTDLFTVDRRKERLCGANRAASADWFLQRTFYGEPPTLVRDFDDVKYGCGYGIVVNRDEKAIETCLRRTDWMRYSNLAGNSARHISMYHIENALAAGGFSHV